MTLAALRIPRYASLLLAGALSLGCPADNDGGQDGGSDDHGHEDETGHDHDNESEVITTVTLTFAPQGGGDSVVVSFTDPDGDGGMSGMADALMLTAGQSYDLSVAFFNELEDPAEEITEEIEEEAEEHQIFISGDGVMGPAGGAPMSPIAEHAYADTESTYGSNAGDDLPVGLANTFTATTAGSGTVVVRLQHLPELNGAPQKVAGLAEVLAAGDPVPGDVDALVTFELTVQ